MSLKNCFAAAHFAALAVCLFSAGAQAQPMYRCGNVYQDRPCTSDVPQRQVPGTGGAAKSETVGASKSAGVDADCKRRGEAAKVVVWGRETGLTASDQNAKATSAEQRSVIADVYTRRGRSVDIQAGVEADCMAEKERVAQAAALMLAADKLLAKPSGAAPIAPAVESVAGQGSVVAQATPSSQCPQIKENLKVIAEQQRVGGNSVRMESLNQQRQGLDKRSTELRC